MATVASLNVLLKAQTRDLTRGLERGAKSIKSFALKLIAIRAGFQLARSAARQFIAVFNEQRNAIDSLANLSKITGLVVEDVQSLALGAELSGKSFDAIAKGITGFTRRLGSAQRGVGDLIKLSEQLQEQGFDFDATRLAELPAGEALREAFDLIESLPTAFLKADVAAKLFGDNWRTMLALTSKGRESLDGWNKELRDMNANLSNVDTAGVELMNSEFTRAKLAVKAMSAAVVVKLAPGIIVATRAVLNFLKQANQVTQVRANFGSLVDIVGQVTAALKKSVDVLSKIAGVVLVFRSNLLKTQEVGRRREIAVLGQFRSQLQQNQAQQIQDSLSIDSISKDIRTKQEQFNELLEEINTTDSVFRRYVLERQGVFRRQDINQLVQLRSQLQRSQLQNAQKARQNAPAIDAVSEDIRTKQEQLKELLEEIKITDAALTDIYSKSGVGVPLSQALDSVAGGVAKVVDDFTDELRAIEDEIRKMAEVPRQVPPPPDVDEEVDEVNDFAARSSPAPDIAALQRGSVEAVSRIADLFNKQQREDAQADLLDEQRRANALMEKLLNHVLSAPKLQVASSLS
jgi:hypothetical protein